VEDLIGKRPFSEKKILSDEEPAPEQPSASTTE
jgi:hypothetical protein